MHFYITSYNTVIHCINFQSNVIYICDVINECPLSYFVGGTSYEPPLTNVFTMQWFLTLFSTCLPRETVLRVWDLILLEGNEVLLRTALAIWTQLEE